MAKGYDELIEYLLSEIALCGLEGAGSVEFRRFVQNFYQSTISPSSDGTDKHSHPPLSRGFYERVWNWLRNHQDVRIVYRNEPRSINLTEFETFELQETGANGADYSVEQQSNLPEANFQIAPNRTDAFVHRKSIRESLRQRLSAEGHITGHKSSPEQWQNRASNLAQELTHDDSSQRMVTTQNGVSTSELPSREDSSVVDLIDPLLIAEGAGNARGPDHVGPRITGSKHSPRETSRGPRVQKPTFDDPPASTTAPRIYVSQNCAWRAVTGHAMDLKKVSSMQFMLLTIIAAHGSQGILQPDLVKLSGQDKRSVPHRTDELAKAGYIEKKPVSTVKMRTSLIIHKKFVKTGHFLKEPGNAEDVFQNRTLILSSFLPLLYNLLRDAPGQYVPWRDLRKHLGVSKQNWNLPPVRRSIYRLEESGFLKRKRVIRPGSRGDAVVILKLLRPPQEEDFQNLKFRRRTANGKPADGVLEEDEDGDDIMRDLDLEELESEDDEPENDRVPPQWTPERLLSNLTYDTVELTGLESIDGARLRDRTMGKFWKRPTESYLSRLTDNWEQSQPLHLRHLAIVRDTTVTTDKKFVHYIYRTYGNFQKVVDAKLASWAAVSKEASKKASSDKRGRPKKNLNEHELNQWGFWKYNVNDFLHRSGSSTLVECRAKITTGVRRGQLWDDNLTQELGIRKRGRPSGSKALGSLRRREELDVSNRDNADHSLIASSGASGQRLPQANPKKAEGKQRNAKQLAIPLLSAEQRKALNLPPRGRLGIHIEEQIREHRKKTGDPHSLPDVILKDDKEAAHLRQKERTRMKRKPRKPVTEPELFTKEFRKAHGLPEKGRLSQSTIDHYRQLELGITATAMVQGEPSVIQNYANISPLSDTMELQQDPTETDTQLSISTGTKRKANTSEDVRETPKRRRGEKMMPSTPTTDVPTPSADALPVSPAQQEVITSIETPCQAPLKIAPSQKWTEKVIFGMQSPSTPKNKNVGDGNQSDLEQTPLRPNPGLYIYPQATRSIRRGRPRKAFMAVFKIPQLKDLEWLQPDPEAAGSNSFATRSLPSTPSDSVRVSTRKVGLVQESYVTPHTSAAPSVGSNAEPQETSENEFRTATPEVDHTSVTAIAGLLKANIGSQQDAAVSLSDDQMNLNIGEYTVVAPVLEALPQDPSNAPQEDSLEDPLEALPETASLAERAPSAWHAINAPPQLLTSAYKMSDGTNSTAQSHMLHTGDGGSINKTANSLDTEAPVIEAPITHMLDVVDGDYNPPIAVDVRTPGNPYKRPPQQGNFSKRGVPIGRGSIFFLRTQIIQEIVDRCNGVFPLHGELVAPFWKLWEERAGINQNKPDRTTLTNTVNHMVNDPKHNIKKTVLRIPTLATSGVVEKMIIHWRNIDSHDPRILELRNNMIKAHPRKFYPEEIRDLVGPEAAPRKPVLPEIDMDIEINELYPTATAAKKLERRIKASTQIRIKQTRENKYRAHEVRVARNAGVENTLLGNRGTTSKGKPARRKRLETLNTRTQHKPSRSFLGRSNQNDESDDSDSSDDIPLAQLRPALRANSPASDTSEDIPLALFRLAPSRANADVFSSDNEAQSTQLVSPAVELSSDEDNADLPIKAQAVPEDKFINIGPSYFARRLSDQIVAIMMDPEVLFYSNNGTFSTEFTVRSSVRVPGHLAISENSLTEVPSKAVQTSYNFVIEKVPQEKDSVGDPANAPNGDKGRKRVKFVDSSNESRRKRRRLVLQGPRAAPPQLIERLTGLTGNPDDPVYVPPNRKKDSRTRLWAPERPARQRKKKKPKLHLPIDVSYDVQSFKGIFCTLAIATSMSGKEGMVDWSIVNNVYKSDRRLDIRKIKKLWSWLKENMASQFSTFMSTFQESFLEAYESGALASMEDPATYDWYALVKWALRTCVYPELPLPDNRDGLRDYTVEESQYSTFSHMDWYTKALPIVGRSQRLLEYAYASPLHTGSTTPPVDKILLARSWVRANTATTQAVYDANQAHDKLSPLGDSLLTRVVHDLVDERIIRQRKLKRLLPGRNYDFASRSAMSYRRAFELDVFTDGIDFKKALDVAFSSRDLETRAVTVSRTAKDGAVMAMLSLVNDGRVRMVPKLPPVDNNLGAPLPRLSIWGFSEGDYVHRRIDRQRTFWNIDIVPTSTYQFGSPLLPSLESTIWTPLPEPPLPGKNDPEALLPIWSSIDGASITWPWWYRILNLVLQALMFAPGASAASIYTQLPKGTVELFEVELVLKWLVDVNAARVSENNTYETKAGFWAAFGEKLIGMGPGEDWFGEHVTRKKTSEVRQPWKAKYELRSRRVAAMLSGETGDELREDYDQEDEEDEENGFGEGQVLVQYGVVGENYLGRKGKDTHKKHLDAPLMNYDASTPARTTQHEHGTIMDGNKSEQRDKKTQQDVVLDDEFGADTDAEGEMDEDAEGEPEDEML